jgi:uncharacterized protein (TIGR02596 family)
MYGQCIRQMHTKPARTLPRIMKKNTSRNAFSLVELLIVVLIIGIIAGFAIPSVQGMLRSSQLNQASAMLTDSMALARQTAISKNRMVEVRFYRFADNEIPGEIAEDPATGHFRGYQTFEVSESGEFIPLTKIARFPDTIIMNPGIPGGGALSNILGEDRITPAQNPPSMLVTKEKVALDQKAPELPRGVKKSYEYVPMRFLPDGSTNLPPLGAAGTSTGSNPSAGGVWFITVHSFADWDKLKKAGNTAPPPNYFTLQIDPLTAATKTYRPGVK